jgi:hypothetical protein
MALASCSHYQRLGKKELTMPIEDVEGVDNHNVGAVVILVCTRRRQGLPTPCSRGADDSRAEKISFCQALQSPVNTQNWCPYSLDHN